MYEMYPEAWNDEHASRQRRLDEQPRRRSRKPHSVVPAVILEQAEAAKTDQPS